MEETPLTQDWLKTKKQKHDSAGDSLPPLSVYAESFVISFSLIILICFLIQKTGKKKQATQPYTEAGRKQIDSPGFHGGTDWRGGGLFRARTEPVRELSPVFSELRSENLLCILGRERWANPLWNSYTSLSGTSRAYMPLHFSPSSLETSKSKPFAGLGKGKGMTPP